MLVLLLLLFACAREVDCYHRPVVNRVAFSTEERALWATGQAGHFGGCPDTLPRTTLLLREGAEPVVEESDWEVDSTELPAQPAEFDTAFSAEVLDCGACVLFISAFDDDSQSARVTTLADSDHAFHLELLDETGAVLSEGDI